MRKRSGMYFRQVVAAVCALLLAQSPLLLFAQEPQPVNPQLAQEPQPIDPQPLNSGQPAPAMSANELDSLVAPMALYPDALLSQVLVASTYPLELVEAQQWLQRNPGLTGPALTQAAQTQNWDPSVQALVMFPDVLRRLTDDVNWTTNLGNAFLAQQADVMSAVQRMRLSAQQSGKLVSTPQQQVATTVEGGQPVVVITPANPEVIYVPDYDPSWIWGPAAYYPYPQWYFPHRSGFFFNVGISIGGFLGIGWGGWGGWGWHPGWGSRSIFVNNTFIRRNNFNSGRIGNFAGTSGWSHDAFHRQGVRYPTAGLNERFRGNARQTLTSRQAPAIAQGRSFAPSQQGRSFAPSQQGRAIAPSQQGRTFAPSQQGRAIAPSQQGRTFAPSQQGRAIAPSQQGRTFAPSQQGRSFAPSQQGRAFAPSQQGRAFAPQQQRSTGGFGQARSAAPMARSVTPSRSAQRSAPASRGGGRSGGRARN